MGTHEQEPREGLARTPEGDRAGVTSPTDTEFLELRIVYSSVPCRLREHEHARHDPPVIDQCFAFLETISAIFGLGTGTGPAWAW